MSSERRRGGVSILVKLTEVAARAIFVLTVTFSLPIEDAGRFGLYVTLIGIFAFGFNFERHVDIQRGAAGKGEAVFDRSVVEALKFFAFNWILLLPLFILCVALWTKSGWVLISLSVVVVIGEHLSNQAYQYALFDGRYRPMLAVVASKNVMLALLVVAMSVHRPGDLELGVVLVAWALGSAFCVCCLAAIFSRINSATSRGGVFNLREDILRQHVASATHFSIGLLATLMLQCDRLIIGAIASFAETGSYYRHTLLVSLAYQLFGIASFNRIAPEVFVEARSAGIRDLMNRVTGEYRYTLIGAPLLFLGAVLFDRITAGVWSQRYDLSLVVMGVLVLGFMVRALADFHSLVLNALYREKDVLRSQGVAFLVSCFVLVGLTLGAGILGAAVSTVLSAAIYLSLVRSAVRRVAK